MLLRIAFGVGWLDMRKGLIIVLSDESGVLWRARSCVLICE